MDSSRVDAKRFGQAVTDSVKDLEAVEKRIARFVGLLTADERKRYVKGRPDVMAAASGLASRAKQHSAIVDASGFDAEAVAEDLANLTALEALETKVAELQRRLADARLSWEAEVMVPTQNFYGAAGHPARTDAELAATIKPLRDAFSTPRADARKAAGEPSKPSA